MRGFSMRAAPALLVLLGTSLGTSLPAFADGFDLVIPGRRGVPIIMNGRDVSYAVVEGAWGLGHGLYVPPTVYGGRLIDPGPDVGHYYPSAGSLPGYGRLEVDPPTNRKLPKPAASFHESWTSESEPPVPQPQPQVPYYPPPVIQAPQDGAGGMPQDFRRPTSRRPRN
jgi:hypothetical protein